MVLTLRIKKYWFDKILTGEKKVEFRDIKPFYESRIDGKNILQVRLIAGYSKNSPEKLIDVVKIEKLEQYHIHLNI